MQPWIERPYSLINWWQMEQFAASSFYRIGAILCQTKRLASQSAGWRSPAVMKTHGENLDLIGAACSTIGLTQSIKSVHRLEKKYPELTREEFVASVEEIEERINDEMEDHLFMYIPPNRAARYDQSEPFGELVSEHFNSTKFDVMEAGNCFAAGRYTACVFHLMRVLEVGLIAFAKRFPNVPTQRENWQQLIERIEAEIREIPKQQHKASDWKLQHEQWCQIANGFMFFKDAWRNYTAHARGKYTDDEADCIYRNVDSFMRRLAKTGLTDSTLGV